MSEAEIFQAYYNAINLAYTASQWWLTISTALVVATYFAAKHIRPWFFVVVMGLYILTAMSVVYEVNGYSMIADSYLVRIGPFWASSHMAFPNVGGPVAAVINTFANEAIFVIGTICAVAFSFVTWRAARSN